MVNPVTIYYMPTSKKIRIPLTQAEDYARELAGKIHGGEVIALIGDLGSGKTTFTKALGEELGIKQSISSPTFVMMQEFFIPKRNLYLYHLDLYRTKNFNEVESLGITQWWTRPETVTVIEWADKIIDKLPQGAQIIYLYRDAKANQN
jgi:tRNA threonylcarbamoyladenosine biosynthesis protein TsaE